MKEKLISVILISISMGICELILPKCAGIEKYVKMIGTLCILCIITASIVDVIHKIDTDFFDEIKGELIDIGDGANNEYQNIFDEYLNKFSEKELKREISELLNDKFGIPSDECSIVLFTDMSSNGISLNKIQILLSGKSIFKNPYTIEDYFSKLISCECEVLIKQK